MRKRAKRKKHNWISRARTHITRGIELSRRGDVLGFEEFRLAFELMQELEISFDDIPAPPMYSRGLAAVAMVAERMMNDSRRRLINELDLELLSDQPMRDASRHLLQQTQAHLRSSSIALDWLERNPPSGFMEAMEVILNSRRGILPPNSP